MRVLVVTPARVHGARLAAILARLVDNDHMVRVAEGPPMDDGGRSVRAELRTFRPHLVLLCHCERSVALRRTAVMSGRSQDAVVVEMVVDGSHQRPLSPDERPDWVIVADETDRVAAIERFGLPPYRVATVGAPEYDEWFSCVPTVERDTFCARVGLPPEQPFLVVRAIAAGPSDELSTVDMWLRSLGREASRSSTGPGVVLVVPPIAADVWRRVASAHDKVYFLEEDSTKAARVRDAVLHSTGVVTCDVRLLVEAVLADRPGYVLSRESAGIALVPLLRWLQREAAGWTEERATNADDGALPPQVRDQFLERAIRPYGLSTEASLMAVRALEKMFVVGAHRPLLSTKGIGLTRLIVRRLAALIERRARAARPAGAGKLPERGLAARLEKQRYAAEKAERLRIRAEKRAAKKSAASADQ